MTGNLFNMVELINKLREKYMFDTPKGITVGGLGDTMRSAYHDERISMSDCILT